MSHASPINRAYETFLSSCDLNTWKSCLREYQGLFDGTVEPRDCHPVDLLRAVTINHYVAWLARCDGDDATKDEALRRFRALETRIAETPMSDSREVALIHAVIAAAKGYSATARGMLQAFAEPLPVDVAVLTAPVRAARRATWLKPFILDRTGPLFAPALYFYGVSLLDLGYQSETSALLEQYGTANETSLIIDLRGQLVELAGAWEEAREVYNGSGWAQHFYRRTLCELILGESVDRLAGWPEGLVNKFVQGMLDFGGETDRAGVLRSASFVRACRWSGFDNWLVHFELGRLGFQRRRHAEAERRLAAAARTAPGAFQFPILHLRFINLTWMGGEFGLELTPETLEAGCAALQAAATEEQRAPIRTWLWKFEGGTLDPVLASKSDYEIGVAHSLRGSVPDSVGSWRSCIEADYTPRAFFRLLEIFSSWGFEKTASRFADIVALESEDNFFDLSELADALAAAPREPSAHRSGGPFKDQLSRVEARLEELAESDFQDAIRVFYYFHHKRSMGPASRMLQRAEKLAEGPEENLRLAIARRNHAGGEWDLRSLEALRRAELQSSDRLERLLIARELALMGQLPPARAILSEEGALTSGFDLTPIEYVLVLEVAKYCNVAEAERQILEQAAVATLQRDVDAGRFHNGGWFVDRLNKSLGRPLTIPAAKEEAADIETSSWQKLVSELKRLAQEQRSDQELRLLTEKFDALSASPSPFSRFALWGLHRDRLNIIVRGIHQLRPNVADDEIPMARDVSLVRKRAQSLDRMWQQYLLSMAPREAEYRLAEIRDFFDEEKRLTARWDQMWQAEARKPISYAQRYAAQGAVLLDDIRTEVRKDPWPPFLRLGSAILDDAGELADLLAKGVGSELDGMSA